MDSAVLVRDYRDAGWDLLEQLASARFPVTAAFWQYLPESETWRLFLATPLVDEVGSIVAYTRLQTLLNQIPTQAADLFSVMNISLISPHSDQIAELRKRYGPIEKDRSRVRRISLSPDEAYVYLLTA